MKQYTTNEIFREIFHQQKCTQIEMGHRIELDKNSVHDWLKNKNEMKFSSLEKICKHLKLELKISIKKK
jgi:DNA-binding Xre family transcriptional regulator